MAYNTEPTRVESFCVVCHQNGETILLLTKIPFFKEMLIGSFSCDQCGYRNNEIQFVG
jgi:zinc finger protein